MKKKCPCCGYYEIESDDEVSVEICEVCLWQYDEIAQKYPDRVIGPNKISLNITRKNYQAFGVSKKKYVGRNLNRDPTEY